MSLRAIVVNQNTIDYIETHNGGVRPSDACMEKPYFFIFSDDFRDNHQNLLMTEDVFRRNFKFKRIQGRNDNIVVKK